MLWYRIGINRKTRLITICYVRSLIVLFYISLIILVSLLCISLICLYHDSIYLFLHLTMHFKIDRIGKTYHLVIMLSVEII